MPASDTYSSVPLRVENTVALEKEKTGNWAIDYNMVELSYAGTDGRGFYVNAEIVDGPDAGKTLQEIYGDWKISPMGEMTYTAGDNTVTGKVIWSPCVYEGNGSFYISGNFSDFAGELDAVTLSAGTLIIPVDPTYDRTPVCLVDEMHLVKITDGSYIDTAMLDIKVQDNYDTTVDGTDKYDIRFIGSVNSLDYKRAGFVFSIANENPEIGGSKCVVRDVTTVYKSLKGGMGSQEYKVCDIYDTYSKYLYAFEICNIPASKTIYARGFVELTDGTVIYGKVRPVTAPEAK